MQHVTEFPDLKPEPDPGHNRAETIEVNILATTETNRLQSCKKVELAFKH